MKKRRYLLLLPPVITLILELLPYGAVLNFANPEGEAWRETYSYFSLMPFGYGNFAPLITGVISCVLFVLVLLYCVTGKAGLARTARFLLCVCAVFSLGPVVFGFRYLSPVGILITISLIVELLLLSAAAKSDT